MPDTNRCPRCGTVLPPEAPANLCPKCLLQAGLESQSGASAALPPTGSSPVGSASNFVPPTPAELAEHFPQLEILELLGKGGMGAVYKARQRQLDRMVAVKVLPREMAATPGFAERFAREAQALARLNHPNIVAVYDFGETGNLYYFVMEFVDGVSVRQAIQTHELTSQQSLAIVPQICEALQFAHDEGIVHRDIKPENILLDKKRRVKIADFGLAKLLGRAADQTNLTGTNQMMGTWRYMAPEQIETTRDVDHRADIYSLGVVFYEMLTGELPLGRFAPPSKKVQIDVRLDEVVLRTLEKEPERRYQHASQVKSEVDAIRSTPGSAPDALIPDPSPPLAGTAVGFVASAPTSVAAAGTGGTARDRSSPLSIGRLARIALTAGLVWLLFPLLWNVGIVGEAIACLGLGLFVVIESRRAECFLPSTAAKWRTRNSFCRWGLLIFFTLFAAGGFYFIFVACYQSWEAFNWHPMACSGDEFEKKYQGAEHKILRYLRDTDADIPRAELVQTRFYSTGGWNFSWRSPPNAQFFETFPIGAALVIGLALIWGAYAALLLDEKLIDFGWGGHSWINMQLFAATMLPCFAGALLMMAAPIYNANAFSGQSRGFFAKYDIAAVVARMDAWAATHGFESGDDYSWRLDEVQYGGTMAKVELRHLWRPSVFDRWQMTPRGLRRTAPDLVLEIFGDAAGKLTFIWVGAKLRGLGNADDKTDLEELDSICQALKSGESLSPVFNQTKPVDEKAPSP